MTNYSNNLSGKSTGRVVTFYSFKGGVGRSMALANVGVLLAREGYKVLCIDWDLEAPGLGRYLATVPRSVLDTKPHLTAPKRPGGLLAILEESKPGQLTKWQDYLHVRIGTNGTKFDFIGSGDNEDGYSEKLGCFSWSDFFAQRSGGDIIESLRDEWREIYDYVLIDSRTGLTDSSGVSALSFSMTPIQKTFLHLYQAIPALTPTRISIRS